MEGRGLRHRRKDEEIFVCDYEKLKSRRYQERKSSKCCKCSFMVLLGFVGFVAVFSYFILIADADFDPQPYQLDEPPELVGPLANNENQLSKAEKLLENQIFGPESILHHQGRLYTGTYDGKVVEIVDNKITREIKWNKEPCGSLALEAKCGRPLGIRMTESGELLVLDAYLGMFSVNMTEGSYRQLFSSNETIGGRPMKFLNDLAIFNKDLILFTDSSSKWERRQFLHIGMESVGDGRLLKYVPSTGEIGVVLDNLHFPNGIEVIDQTHVLIAETTKARIARYHLSGPRSGQFDYFRTNLPGLPDNIRLSSDSSTIWVGFAAVREKGKFSLMDWMADRVWMRKLVIKMLPERWLMNLYQLLKPKHGLIVQMNKNGEYLLSLHDTSGYIADVSQVTEIGDHLILGSYHSSFIAKYRK